MYAIRQWAREKIVNGVDQLIMMLGHVIFLILTRPSAANDNFPYYIKTTQIGFISEESAERPGNYEISEEEMKAKSGPNLNDIFTVSHTRSEPSAPPEERPLSRTRLSRPYSGDRPSSRTQLTKPSVQESEASTSAGESDNDTPPPSYTSLTKENSSLQSSDYTSQDMFASRPQNSLPPLSTEKRSRLKKNGALPPINKHDT